MKRCKLIRVRLTDIPFDERMKGARVAVRAAADKEESSAILLAALFPSDKVYWVRQPEETPLSAAA